MIVYVWLSCCMCHNPSITVLARQADVKQRRLDTITCTQKVVLLPHMQHCTKCKSRSGSKALRTALNVKASWNPWEKKIQHHTPPVHPSYFLQIEKTRFSERQQQKKYLLIVVGFFRCYNIRSTRFISVSALDLAIVHKRKHFLLPGTLANGLLLNAWQHNCIPRSCDYSVNVRHVQPPLPLSNSSRATPTIQEAC